METPEPIRKFIDGLRGRDKGKDIEELKKVRSSMEDMDELIGNMEAFGNYSSGADKHKEDGGQLGGYKRRLEELRAKERELMDKLGEDIKKAA
jgi:hypothetical protein